MRAREIMRSHFLFLFSLSELHLVPRAAPALVLQSGVVALGRVHVRVAQHVGHQIDIAGLPVQVSAVEMCIRDSCWTTAT